MAIDLRALALLAALGVAVAGCTATGGPREAAGIADDQGRLVARDFVAALVQLRGYDPRNTTVQMRAARTAFGEALADELRRAGYGMQLVADDESAPLLVSWASDGFENASGRSVGYRLRVGAVELGREYELRAGRVFPMTALSVRGVPIGREPLDDGIFDRNRQLLQAAGDGGDGTDPPGGDRPGAADAPLVPAIPSGDEGWRALPSVRTGAGVRVPGIVTPSVAEGAGEVVRTPADSAFGTRVRAVIDAPVPTEGRGSAPDASENLTARRSGGDGSSPTGIAARVQRNVLEIGRSNFAPLLAGYDVAEEHVLVFGDDSLRLGADNKAVLQAVADRLDPTTDLVSVLGCSHGPTAVEGGNALLATGRAHRVKEALIRAGVEAGAVLDEGCWAPTAQPDRPARAVVIARRTRSPDGPRT